MFSLFKKQFLSGRVVLACLKNQNNLSDLSHEFCISPLSQKMIDFQLIACICMQQLVLSITPCQKKQQRSLLKIPVSSSQMHFLTNAADHGGAAAEASRSFHGNLTPARVQHSITAWIYQKMVLIFCQ